jgi:hypothetical protein
MIGSLDVLLLVLCAVVTVGNAQFSAASPAYRFSSSVPASSVKTYPDQVKRRAILVNYSGSDVVRFELDSLIGSGITISNANSQGAGFVDSNSDYYYGFSCNGNDVYFTGVNLITMTQNFTTKISTFTCNDLPTCAAYDPTSKTAVFALANSRVLGTVNITTGIVSKLTNALTNDNKFSCTFDTNNRTAYFASTTSSLSTIDMTQPTFTVKQLPIQGPLASQTYVSPVIVFDSTNSALYMTVQYSQNVPSNSFILVRYQPLISNWTTLTGSSSLGQGQGIMVDQVRNIPYVFTPSNTLVYPDAYFANPITDPINVWSLMGQGFVDTIPSIATTNGFAADRDIAEIVIIQTSGVSVPSFTIAFIFAMIVCMIMNY